jgi:thiol peroxidase
MAKITLGGNPAETSGDMPAIGSKTPSFTLTAGDMSSKSLSDFRGHKLVLNIFPSIETGVCSASVRNFNKEAAKLNNTKVLCISRDLPFTQSKFCAAEGIENVIMLSDFKNKDFGNAYGLEIHGSNFDGLLARAVIVTDENGTITHTELVPEISHEPNYKAAINAL